MEREWKNRKVVRPPAGVDVEVGSPTGQGTLAVKVARYKVETWCYLDADGIECECPIETFEIWREIEPAPAE